MLLLTFSAGLRAVCTVPSSAYYVATNGNDSWSGTLAAPNAGSTDGPFRTLTKAQTVMQGAGQKTTVIRGGTYPINPVWHLSAPDSGELWIGYPGETVLLEGGGAGGVDMNNGGAGGVRNVTFDSLTFQNTGLGLLIGGDDSIIIRRNTFLNCNTSCLLGGGVTNALIDSNHFNGQFPGNIPGAGVGAAWTVLNFWYGSSGNRITHNLIENAQGGGIGFTAGIGDNPNLNNLIDRNLLKNVDSNVTDMGAIYFYDTPHTGTGNVITNNTVIGNGDAAHSTKAFYLDDGVSNMTVTGNVCTKCGQWAWQIHSGDHNTIANNIFDLSMAGSQAGVYQYDTESDHGMQANVLQKNLIYFGSGSVPSSLYTTYMAAGDALPASARNLYYTTNAASIPNGAVIVDSAPVYANPLFAAPGSGNYTMPATSPAFTQVGFNALATDQGPQPECGGPVTTSSGYTGIRTVTVCSSISSTGNPSRCSNTKLSFVNGILQ